MTKHKTLFAILIVLILLAIAIPLVIESLSTDNIEATTFGLPEQELNRNIFKENLSAPELTLLGFIPLILVILLFLYSIYLIINFIKKNKKTGLILLYLLSKLLLILSIVLEKDIFLFAILPLVFLILVSIALIYLIIKLTIKFYRLIIRNKKIFLFLLFISLTFFASYNLYENPEITGFTVEDIYDFIIPRDISEEFTIPLINKTNETTFKIPTNDTQKITEPIEEPSFKIPNKTISKPINDPFQVHAICCHSFSLIELFPL